MTPSPGSTRRDAPLSPLELASGIVTGGAPAPRLEAVHAPPGERLLRAIAPALRRGRCLVSFSGGLDSSLVLAAATRAARREGLPDPVPVTWRFAAAPAAEESRWQDEVVRELGLRDWERINADADELDLLGPVATESLVRHGVLHPANAFLHGPLLARARHGTLLTGVGGDQILGLWRWREAAALLRRERAPRPRAVAALALSRAPVPLRTAVERRRAADAGDGATAAAIAAAGGLATSPWLRPGADRRVQRAHARERAAEPATWSRRVPWQSARRQLSLGLASLQLLASDAGARIEHPLLDPGFLAALATSGGRLGCGSRSATISALLGDVLPDSVLARRDKALFHEVFWHGPSRAAMRAWNGDGVDETIVDPVALRSLWHGPSPPPRTALLVQHVWLAQRGAQGSVVR